MAFDPLRGLGVLFGDGQTWEWDGKAGLWTLRRTLRDSPELIWPYSMAWDPGRQVVLLFGDGQTWEWDGAVGTWSDRTTERGPTRGALVTDPLRGRVLLVHGLAEEMGRGLPHVVWYVWEWDGSAGVWLDRTRSREMPGPRHSPKLTYDTMRQRTLLFGGGEGEQANDIWEWEGGDRELDLPGARGGREAPRALAPLGPRL